MEINVLIQCCAFISPAIPLLSWFNEMGGYYAANKPCIENLSHVIIWLHLLLHIAVAHSVHKAVLGLYLLYFSPNARLCEHERLL